MSNIPLIEENLIQIRQLRRKKYVREIIDLINKMENKLSVEETIDGELLNMNLNLNKLISKYIKTLD